MARFSSAFKTTGAGSTTLPIGSIFATTGVRPVVREIGVVNTSTSTAVDIAIRRCITAVGTPGTGQAEVGETDPTQTAIATVFDTHTVAPTFVTGSLRAATLIAGAGTIWTFGERGLVIPNSANDGIAIIPLVGTGQICTVYFSWDE